MCRFVEMQYSKCKHCEYLQVHFCKGSKKPWDSCLVTVNTIIQQEVSVPFCTTCYFFIEAELRTRFETRFREFAAEAHSLGSEIGDCTGTFGDLMRERRYEMEDLRLAYHW